MSDVQLQVINYGFLVMLLGWVQSHYMHNMQSCC